ncbi:MAG: RNA methyltransferase [Oscillochloris sp.]|nr:RNA methyltransferase [Oscillochloris sp.]
MITSPSNAAIKAIRSLKQRKERTARQVCFVEGIRLVGEAIQLGVTIEQLVVAPELLSSSFGHALVAQAASAGVPRLEVSGEVFVALSGKDGPQGLGAVVRQRWESPESLRLDDAPGWIALSSVADPGNLGTILRTADAVGASGVILLDESTDPYDPAAIRASMGALFAQRLVRTTFDAFAAWKRATGAYLLGTADSAGMDYQATTYPQPLVLLMGSERQGLPAEQQALCDLLVAIPMRGRSDSLNLAVASGVMLYELLRQRRG